MIVERMLGRLNDPGLAPDDQRLEQIFLVFEIDVERTLRDAGLAGDVVHAGGVETLAHEDPPRALEDLFALGRVLARRMASAAGTKLLVRAVAGLDGLVVSGLCWFHDRRLCPSRFSIKFRSSNRVVRFPLDMRRQSD
ncbi:hypothetical protein D9M69_620200 [compost metagenome]